jgi:hypothetical protein
MSAPTGSPAPPVWPTCQASDGCRGVRVSGRGICLAHLNESELASWLATLEPGSDLDLRGTDLAPQRLDRLLDALHDQHGHPLLGAVRFDEAQFSGDVGEWVGYQLGSPGFDGAQFTGNAQFDRAQFSGNAWFGNAQFGGDASFRNAQFGGDATFDNVQFGGDATFRNAQFSGDASFGGTQFSGHAEFTEAQFSRNAAFSGAEFRADNIAATFEKAQFNGYAGFRIAQFSGQASFEEVQFSGDAEFAAAQFGGNAKFDAARFVRPVTLGPLLVRGTLRLTAASFEDTLVMHAVAALVYLDRVTCATSVSLRLRYAEVVLDGVRLTQPMAITAADPFWENLSLSGLIGSAFARPRRSPTPRLLSVSATDVANLVVTDLSLAPCRFAGANRLDQLRLEGRIEFAHPPRGVKVGWTFPPVWWWTRRQTLAEEQAWRATQPKGAGWHGPETQPIASLKEATPMEEAASQPPGVIGPERLAGLYRALRQAQEDRKNEPGAADFYYGEMEMRRLAGATPWAERVILSFYWLVAGYGLRGLRALTALAVVVVALASLFHAVGFLPTRPAPSWWDSLLYTAGSTLSISDDTLKLTAWGKLLRILLRLLGPLLLGLALLSVRNRVKR